MKHIYTILCFFYGFISIAQTEFFKSKVPISEYYLSNFYSSFKLDSNQVYFNANDYKLYALDKKTGLINWSYNAESKSNYTPKSFKNNVLVSVPDGRWVQLNAKTGDTIQTLKISELITEPFFKGDTMYCAAISSEIGGAILAYDLKKNAIIWKKYLGHGVSYQPYFFKDKIAANFENEYWYETDYNGNPINKDSCYYKKEAPPFEERFCSINYDILNKSYNDILIKNITIEETQYYYTNNTVASIKKNELKIVDKNNGTETDIIIDTTIPLLKTNLGNYKEILKVEQNSIWFIYKKTLINYDYVKNITLKIVDLAKWKPHQAVLENDNLWLISKNDGQLYGLKIN